MVHRPAGPESGPLEVFSGLLEAVPEQVPKWGFSPHPTGPRARASGTAVRRPLQSPSSGHLCRRAATRRQSMAFFDLS